MSQAVITTEFERLKAQQAASGAAVVLDGFIFAHVPNLDDTTPIDPTEAIPADAQIVHRADVSLTGVVNENAVVYSVTLGTAIGDFDFNWVGLVNKASNTLAMIVHAPVQHKVANASGVQGNVLTRSFLMEYEGAKKQTEITTPAATWQIDFTARLAGIDERQRIENIDIYGVGAFCGEGFLVKRSGNNYSVTAGSGYVGGLRVILDADQPLVIATKPVKVWVDASFTGTLTSVWQVQTTVMIADTLADYVKDGVMHYVFAVAQINADGSVTDLRQIGSNADDKLAKHIAAPNDHPQYAFKDSPVLTGKPVGPTATPETNDSQLATTAFVRAAIAALISSSPGTLDTLNELAEALGDDPHFATTMLNALAGKQPLDDTLNKLSGKNVAQLCAFLGLVIGSNAGNVVTCGSEQPVYKSVVYPGMYQSAATNGYIAKTDIIPDSLSKVMALMASSSKWTLEASMGVYCPSDSDPNNAGIVLSMTDYFGFTRIWSFFNNGRITGPTGEIASQSWSSERFLLLDGATHAGFVMNDGNRPYIQHKDSGTVVELQKNNIASLGITGWKKDGNTGEIIQWGLANGVGDDTPATVNFPTAFPNACLSFMTSIKRSTKTSNNTTMLSCWGDAQNNSSGIVVLQSNGFEGDARNADIYWEARGY